MLTKPAAALLPTMPPHSRPCPRLPRRRQPGRQHPAVEQPPVHSGDGDIYDSAAVSIILLLFFIGSFLIGDGDIYNSAAVSSWLAAGGTC